MIYRIAICTRWGRRHEVDGQFVPITFGVLAVFLGNRGWSVVHVPSAFMFPKFFATARQAHDWSYLFWEVLLPSERVQLMTSVTPESVAKAAVDAWNLV